jgi:hypothetical protein
MALGLPRPAAANTIESCAGLHSIIQLGDASDEVQVIAISDNCVAVGLVTFGSEATYPAFWLPSNLLPRGLNPDNPFVPDIQTNWYLPDTSTWGNYDAEALNVNNENDVLMSWGYTTDNGLTMTFPYFVMNLLTGDFSGPLTNPPAWANQPPQLTNSSGWTVEYAPGPNGGQDAYLVNTPESGSGLLCLLGVAVSLLSGFFWGPHRSRIRQA